MDDTTIAAKAALARAEAIAALAAHPAMPEALRSLLAGLTDVFERRRLLGLFAGDRVRLLVAYLALYLDALHDPSDSRSGLTAERYKALCASTGLCSAWHAAVMLRLMRFAGYLTPSRVGRGARRRLVPTEKFRAAQRDRWRRVFAALARVRPEGAMGLARVDDPGFAKPFIRAACGLFLARERPIAHAPAMTVFAEQKAGYMVLFALMLSAPPGDDMPPTGPMSVAVDKLARRFAVSRRHVRNALDRAVAAGQLVRAGADGTAYVMAPRLRTDVVAFFAAMLLIVAEAIVQVEAAERVRPLFQPSSIEGHEGLRRAT
jgi:hypothetical protein